MKRTGKIPQGRARKSIAENHTTMPLPPELLVYNKEGKVIARPIVVFDPLYGFIHYTYEEK